ncbi:MAG: single-stranded-DNA-specific exonuclease RecJ [Cytophagales bacterium]|nr:single-stranded-DNA-specific exonuclease RecJ [Bernardetiaceae bacterium]MDW8203800.1 single-stranded-DNA-specific exonuclease RecJ [Cytophagales bacterium]
MEKRWVVKPVPDSEQVASLASAINVSAPLATLLLQRGVATFEQARAFFRPSLDQLHNPFLMKDMDKAVWRLEEAIRNEERILIYGDYDVDGTTSVAMFYTFLRRYYSNVLFYTPDRYTEGYGISITGIDWAKQQGVSLIISLDCGIKSNRAISYAADLGIDFIVCDHHLPGDSLPPAFAVLDPKRTDCPYPYKELSGCGVGFKFLHAFSINNNLPTEWLFSFLDLLAVSIAADIVPITGENRILAHFGLRQLNQNPRPGLKALIDISDLRGEIEVANIVFGIGPRINAVGRVAHASHAIRLLSADNLQEAVALAAVANANNEERREFDSNITREAIEMIEQQFPNRKSTVLFKENWHKGVIGIVAARCIEKYYRPTIILTQSDEKATGSARSIVGFDIYEAIAECADLLEQYGGHKYAAGLTMPLANLQAFQERFEQVVAASLREEDLLPQIEVDLEIKLAQISFKFLNIIRQMAPFGPQNMQPVFVARRVQVLPESVRILKDIHLKFAVRQEDSVIYDVIGFNMAPDYEAIVRSGQTIDIAFNLQENDYKGRKSLQLQLRDVRLSEL